MRVQKLAMCMCMHGCNFVLYPPGNSTVNTMQLFIVTECYKSQCQNIVHCLKSWHWQCSTDHNDAFNRLKNSWISYNSTMINPLKDSPVESVATVSPLKTNPLRVIKTG